MTTATATKRTATTAKRTKRKATKLDKMRTKWKRAVNRKLSAPRMAQCRRDALLSINSAPAPKDVSCIRRAVLVGIGRVVTSTDKRAIRHSLLRGLRLARFFGKPSWTAYFRKMLLLTFTGVPFVEIFKQGNGKLPYWTFSTLPAVTCPGAGACLDWCYSFRGWRCPGAYARQWQNTYLLANRPDAVSQAFRRLPSRSIVRLYVDGDFSNIADLTFWFTEFNAKRTFLIFGYSKSWEVFLEWEAMGKEWPANYVLNLSSGSKYDDDVDIVQRMEALPITRGHFIAVDTPYNHVDESRYDDKAYHRAVREQARIDRNTKNPFSCPGLCGFCDVGGLPACGNADFRVVIANGNHGRGGANENESSEPIGQLVQIG